MQKIEIRYENSPIVKIELYVHAWTEKKWLDPIRQSLEDIVLQHGSHDLPSIIATLDKEYQDIVFERLYVWDDWFTGRFYSLENEETFYSTEVVTTTEKKPYLTLIEGGKHE